MGMSYGHAHQVKNRSALSLIVKKFAEGQGLGSAISNTLSEKSAAKMVLMKERLDPMSWSRKLGGKFGAALYGRAMGRSAADMRYFTGYSPKRSRYKIPTSKDKNPNINPLYTKISSTSVTPVRKNDSVSDILAKLYNYMKINHEKDIKRRELKHNFKEGLDDKVNKQHKDLVKVLKDSVGKSDKNTTPNNSENLWAGIIDKIFDLGKFVLGGALINKILNKPKTITEKSGGQQKEKKPIKETSKSGTPKPGKEIVKKTPKPGKETSKKTAKKPFEKFKPKSKTTPEKIKERIAERSTVVSGRATPANKVGERVTKSKTTTVKIKDKHQHSKIKKSLGRSIAGALNKAFILWTIHDVWKEIQSLNPKDFNSKDEYSRAVTKLIGEAIVKYGFTSAMMGIGGLLGASLGFAVASIPGFLIGIGIGYAASEFIDLPEQDVMVKKLVKKIVDNFWIDTTDVESNALNEKDFVMSDLKGPNGEKSFIASGGSLGYRDSKTGHFFKFDEKTIQNSKNRAKEHLLKTNPLAEGISAVGGVTDKIENKIGVESKKLKEKIITSGEETLTKHGWLGGKDSLDIIKESVVDSLSSVVKAAHNAPRLITIEKGSALANAIDEYTKLEMGSDGSYKNNAASNMVVNKNSVNSSETPPTLPTGDVRNKGLYKYIPYQAQ